MKRIITATGLSALAAMLVLGAFAGSAFAVPQFLWTGPLPGLVLVKSDNPQVFQAAPGLTVVCQKFSAHGRASNGTAMTTKEITIKGTYTECKTTEPIAVAAEVSPAEYLLNAAGSITVKNEIVVTIPLAGCNIKIKAVAANENLKTIVFLNNANGTILAHAEVTKIASEGSGGACGEVGVENKEGIYRGLLLASLDGGTIKWDA
jgi:hypothetical protein